MLFIGKWCKQNVKSQEWEGNLETIRKYRPHNIVDMQKKTRLELNSNSEGSHTVVPKR